MGWGSGVAVGCGVGHGCILDPALLWLWCRSEAVNSNSTPNLGTSICHRCGPKNQKKKRKKKKAVRLKSVKLNHLAIFHGCSLRTNMFCQDHVDCLNALTALLFYTDGPGQ